jgi:hypothetical protein
MMKLLRSIATLAFAAVCSQAQAASFYLFDGDSLRGFEVSTNTGAVLNTFTTYQLGYPVAIRSSIWLGQRDDSGGREFSLGGVATGATSVGGNAFSQLLDGATGTNGKNYGVECCGATNSVTVANGDWSGQTSLFSLGFSGGGIAYDGSDDTLLVSELGSGAIRRYDLSGNLLNSFNLGGFLVGLAWDETTDSFWALDRSRGTLLNFEADGSVLGSVAAAGVLLSANIFGGEIAVVGGNNNDVPAPATLALALAALAGMGAMRRRAR